MMTPTPALARQSTSLSADAPALRSAAASAMRARRCLILFAGRPRKGSLVDALQRAGWVVDAVDIQLGGDDHDLMDAGRQEAVLRAAEHGCYQLIWIGTPCASFSVLWTQASRPRLRDRYHPRGLPGLSEHWQEYVERHNTLADFSAAAALVACDVGATFVIESPVDRGMRQSPHFRWAWRQHAPIWLMPSIRALATLVRPRWVTFAQCAWASAYQKWTTLMIGGRLSRNLDMFNDLPCCHTRHDRVAHGYDSDGASNARPAGEYPVLMCAAIAAALSSEVAIPPSRWADWLHMARFGAEAQELLRSVGENSTASAHAALHAVDVRDTSEPASLRSSAHETAVGDLPQETASAQNWRSAPQAMPVLWPEREDVYGERARETRAAALRYTSRRRAEPEQASVLASEVLPVPHPPPTTAAVPRSGTVPWPPGAPPRPIKIDQLYYPGVYAAIRQFIQVLANDLRVAETAVQRGEPLPQLPFRGCLEFPAETSQPPWARSCVWCTTDPHDCVPLQPFSEDDRPDQDVDWTFFAHWGEALQWPDHDMLYQVTTTGCDSRSSCPRNTVIFGHHRGLRARYAPAKAVVDDDTAHGWVSLGTPDLHTVPQRLVPRNVVAQQKWKMVNGELVEVTKWRVTTDDSMDAPNSESRNTGIGPDTAPKISLPTLRDLGRAVAILQTDPTLRPQSQLDSPALHNVIIWALDLSSAYRRLAAARHERWLQGFVWHDGVRTDRRCEFGSAHLVDFFERVSSFVLAVARSRIRRFDVAHPYGPARAAWQASRVREGLPDETTYASIYLDDGFGATCLDAGAPIKGKPPGAPTIDISVTWSARTGRLSLHLHVGMSRAQIHLAIARYTFVEAGWEVATEKVQLGPRVELLGLALDTRQGGFFFIPEAKKQGIRREVLALQPPALESHFGERTAVERLVGRLGHISQVVAEGNAHMQPLFRLQNATFKVRTRAGKRKRSEGHGTQQPAPLYRRVRPRHIRVYGETPALQQFQHALSWWAHVLSGHVTIPLAPRLVFPEAHEVGCLYVFTDAAREDGTGHGGFTCVQWTHASSATFYYLSKRWTADVLRQLQTDAFSMPAGEAFGAVVLIDAVLTVFPSASHLICFSDSDATARGLTTAASGAPQLNHLFDWLCSKWPRTQFLGVHQQGVRNGVSDALSRQERGAAAAVHAAAAAGLSVVELAVCPEYSDLLAAAIACPLRRSGDTA